MTHNKIRNMNVPESEATMANTLSYTAGNWAVNSKVTDTIGTAKNFSSFDLDYTSDYAVSSNTPSEVKLVNTTASDLIQREQLRYGYSPISNVYRGTNIDASSQYIQKTGIQTLAEIKANLECVNSVSGQEISIPVSARIVLTVPTAPFVTASAVSYVLKRCVAAALDTGVVTESRELELLRGSLTPSGL